MSTTIFLKQRAGLEDIIALTMLQVLALLTLALGIPSAVGGSTCTLKPLGSGLDDTDQVSTVRGSVKGAPG